MNKIVVTGSCGFIGYNFINSLNQISEIVGIDSLNELIVKNQEQINLIEEDQKEENQDQIISDLLENVQSKVGVEFKSEEFTGTTVKISTLF